MFKNKKVLDNNFLQFTTIHLDLGSFKWKMDEEKEAAEGGAYS